MGSIALTFLEGLSPNCSAAEIWRVLDSRNARSPRRVKWGRSHWGMPLRCDYPLFWTSCVVGRALKHFLNNEYFMFGSKVLLARSSGVSIVVLFSLMKELASAKISLACSVTACFVCWFVGTHHCFQSMQALYQLTGTTGQSFQGQALGMGLIPGMSPALLQHFHAAQHQQLVAVSAGSFLDNSFLRIFSLCLRRCGCVVTCCRKFFFFFWKFGVHSFVFFFVSMTSYYLSVWKSMLCLEGQVAQWSWGIHYETNLQYY